MRHTESHAKNGKLFRGRPARIHFNTKVTRSNSTFYKKLKRNMSRFKALWVIDLSHSRRSIDLLTDVQTFLNRGGHETNIWCACLTSCLTFWGNIVLDFSFHYRHWQTLIETLAGTGDTNNFTYFTKQKKSLLYYYVYILLYIHETENLYKI